MASLLDMLAMSSVEIEDAEGQSAMMTSQDKVMSSMEGIEVKWSDEGSNSEFRLTLLPPSQTQE